MYPVVSDNNNATFLAYWGDGPKYTPNLAWLSHFGGLLKYDCAAFDNTYAGHPKCA